MWRQFLARTLAGSLLVYTGISGISRFPQEFRDSETLLQRVTEVGVLAYGIAGVVAAIALLLRHRWAVPAAVAWAVAVAYTGSLAPVSFGGTSVWIGVASGILSALVGAAVVWLARIGARPRPE